MSRLELNVPSQCASALEIRCPRTSNRPKRNYIWGRYPTSLWGSQFHNPDLEHVCPLNLQTLARPFGAAVPPSRGAYGGTS